MSKKDILYPDKKDGIYLYEYPVINGIKQYIQIRGANKRNPLILFIHGGPGGALSGITHIVHEGWEDRYTIVNWDQRNAGNTYVVNSKEAAEIAQTGSMDDFMQDVEDIIAYLHTVYEFEKIVLMGFSWGSAISTEYAKRNPQNVRCVINIGQHVNYKDGILCGCHKLLEKIPEGSGDSIKIRGIIDNFPDKPEWDGELMSVMRYFMPIALKYYGKHMKKTPVFQALTSPFMNLQGKMVSTFPKMKFLKKSYATMMHYDFRQNMRFEVPAYFIFGEDDISCPSDLLKECFDEIDAPKKEIYIIEKAGHSCYYDNQEKFLEICSLCLI